jgi:hypothetical protein
MWEIIDNDSIIFSGNQTEIEEYWWAITDRRSCTNEVALEATKDLSWSGDLKLINVISIYN